MSIESDIARIYSSIKYSNTQAVPHCNICARPLGLGNALFVSTRKDPFPGKLICSHCRDEKSMDSIRRELEE